mgnify:CR=1 FL=1
MKVLIDMNISPVWEKYLSDKGFQARHWLNIGNPDAPDIELFEYARKNGEIIITHDLDFSIILALTKDKGPSVVQIRSQNIMSDEFGELLCSILDKYSKELTKGALITIDSINARVRLLPIK